MKYIYEEVINTVGEKLIKRTDEEGNEAWVPTDLANSDYQAYLRWLENPDAEITPHIL